MVLGFERHPENTLPYSKISEAKEVLFCSIWVWASIPRIDHPQKITPGEAVTCSLSQPLIADQNQLLGYQRQEALDILWGWLSPCTESVHSHVMPSCLQPPQYSQTDRTQGRSSKLQIVCYLLKPTTLMAVTCTQLLNKGTIVMHPSYPLHPVRGFSFFWSYLGVCGLLCHTGWVMKGYREQPETWYWRHVIISDIKRSFKFDFFFFNYFCYDNCIWVFTFQPYPTFNKLKRRMH